MRLDLKIFLKFQAVQAQDEGSTVFVEAREKLLFGAARVCSSKLYFDWTQA